MSPTREIDRRGFLRHSAGTLAGVVGVTRLAAGAASSSALPTQVANAVAPITDEERRRRIERAQRLMAEQGIRAIVLEPGSSAFYYTGVRWGLSERPFLTLISARGLPAYVVPAFEEERARELIAISSDIRVWQEDESPYHVAAQLLRDRGTATGRVGIEEEMRFFVFDGIRRVAPRARLVSAMPVTRGCRMIKSAAEIAHMQLANDLTINVFRSAFASLVEGITQDALAATIAKRFAEDAVSGGALVLFGSSTAFPHGSREPKALREGDVVLVDGGCSVGGYQSDVTRTIVLGIPTPRQRDIWTLERRAQDAAFAAAQVGATCESVDAAARKLITDAGFGPGYRVPGLPHRTGHGIGLDGHESPHFVRGEKMRLRPGMCFSDEPTIVIYPEFGIRLEDCLYMTESGPHMFTKQSEAIDRPF